MKHKLHTLKKFSAFIALAILLLGPQLGWGQIITFDFAGLTGSELSATSNSNDPNLTSSTITRGAGLTASNNGDRFNATSWALTSIADAVSGDDYMEFAITPNSGYQFDVSSIAIKWQRSATGNTAIALRSSVDNYASDLDAVKSVDDVTTTQTFTWTFTQANSSSAVTYRIYSYAESTAGSGGLGDFTGNDLIVNGTTSATGGSPIVATPTFTPTGGNYLTTQNVTISCTTDASTIYYTTDGSDPTNTDNVFSTAIPISTNTTIKAIAYATGFDPSSIATAVYTFPVINDVTDINALRGGATDGTIYRLTGEAVLTYQTASRNAKYIQDGSGAILIDDPSGIITTSYNLYDGITNITGTLAVYNNMLQFTPIADPGAASNTGNTVTPVEVTLMNLTTDYQARLIKVINAGITETGNLQQALTII